MMYLFASLLMLSLTPAIAWMVQRFQTASRFFALILVLGISYTIFAHIIWENMEVFGGWSVAVAVAGALVFGFGDDYFFAARKAKTSLLFLCLIQVFLFFHATIDGAALVSSELITPQTMQSGHHHHKELSLSVLMHRMLFEVFIWKYFLDRYGRWPSLLVLLNIAIGTVLGFYGSLSLFHAIPSYFGLFESFIGGALLHLVYDYAKVQVKRKVTNDHVESIQG